MQLIRKVEETCTYYVELDIKDKGLEYKTMDNIVLFPENDPQLVEDFAKLQGWELEKTFILKSTTQPRPKYPFPIPTTIKEALTKFSDLTGLLR